MASPIKAKDRGAANTNGGAPREAIGVTGALFNAAGSVGGIITPIAIGAIVSQTGSYDGALLYVGIHVLAAVAAYWLFVGKIERYAFDR